MLTCNIQAQGKTEDDLYNALEEALKRITEGNTDGKDSCSTALYSFSVTEEEE